MSNIHFSFAEIEKHDDQECTDNFINNIMTEIDEKTNEIKTNENNLNNDSYAHFTDKSRYYCNYQYYHLLETKQLINICRYYGIHKQFPLSKLGKFGIANIIVYFESLPENYEIVRKRHKLWTCLFELECDPKLTILFDVKK